MSELQLWKAIWEIRFPAAAKLFDNRGSITAKWQYSSFDLTEWQITRNQVIVFSKSRRTHLRVGHQVLTVVMEQPDSFDTFCDLAARFSEDTLRRLSVQAIGRTGLRVILIAERDEFDVLVAKMRENLYRLTDEEWALLGGVPVDVGFPLTLRLGDRRANFVLGPMEKEQLANLFESQETKDQLPSVAVIVDFDLFQIAPPFDHRAYQRELRNWMRTGNEQIERLSTQFVDHFGGFK